MNTQTKLSASRLTVMTLACLMAVCLAACGGDDDEPTIDELLSDKTTPVTFELYQGYYYMFDYTGNRYIGSDTIYVDRRGKCELNLRQGKHKILWVGLGSTGYDVRDGIYDVTSQRFLHTGGCQSLRYGWIEIDVPSYLLPAQQVAFEYAAATLKIEPNDVLPFTPEDNGNYLYDGTVYNNSYRIVAIGAITGLPSVQYISPNGGACVFNNEKSKLPIAAIGMLNKGSQELIMTNNYQIPSGTSLCPRDGIADIQLSSELFGSSFSSVPMTTLPVFSLRSGYVTTLRGPLFSGSTDDWTVTMEPSYY